MATAKTAKYIFDVMRRKGLTNWKVKAGNKLIDSEDSNNTDDAITTLRKCLNGLSDGIVEVHLSRFKDSEIASGGAAAKEGQQVIKIDCDDVQGGSSSKRESSDRVSGFDSNAWDQIQALKDQITEMRLKEIEDRNQRRLRALNKKLDAKQAPQTVTEQVISGVIENPQQAVMLVSTLMSLLKGGAPAAMAGFPATPVQILNHDASLVSVDSAPLATADALTEQKKKCSAACGRLLTVDAQAGDALLMLADLAEKNKPMYDVALTQLKAMQGNG